MSIGPVMLDLVGTELLDEDIARLQHPASGGIILFSRNFTSREQVARLVRDVRMAAGKPLIIAVDHEGGRVQRFRDGFSRIPPMAWLGSLYDEEPQHALTVARSLGWLMAAELRQIDIDISFAPVLDLGVGRCDVIGDRAFHAEPAVVMLLAEAFMAGMHDAGMATTGKHFPGHGAVTEDSHIALPVDDRPFDDVARLDLQPFEQLVGKGLDAVMPAHVIYSACDPEPAGFSSFWLQQVLRKQLGFDGVIFSDDLTMEGAAHAGGYAERAHAALGAGCDMVLVCNDQQAAETVLDAVSESHDAESARRLERMLGRNGDFELAGAAFEHAQAFAAEGMQWSTSQENLVT